MSQHLLLDATYTVPPAEPAANGVAWLRANVVRFSEGADHARRRAIVESELAGVDLDALRRPGNPVAKLAHELGLPRGVVCDVSVVARAYQPHTQITAQADQAVARLVGACGRVWDEASANRIGLLIQACDATNALIAGRNPPVPVTRRVAPDGTTIEISLADAPFGLGRHACPGRAHAEALAEGTFDRLHHADTPLLLPNAWDFASAAALVEAGFDAIGTTSLGVAAANGLPDATGATRRETLNLARALVGLPVPISVDAEAGFGDPAGLAEELAEIGIAGVNLEDGRGARVADADTQALVISSFKQAAPHLFVNARIDTHWLSVDHDSTINRALRYVDAGADGIFVPGLTDPSEITRVAAAVPAPLNVLAQPGLSVSRLAELGVRRISTGSLLFRNALRATVEAACAVRDGEPVSGEPSYDSVQDLVARALNDAWREPARSDH
ncbi:MAG TPA: isocitrate lyase/phosphoenolpyruvate mutase family protein [Streptosporangiaceae bacterium]|nr:isocitrate lyase/phosphoenolpyruvate mutase family protein [Streptosporangiaceae bacterium]